MIGSNTIAGGSLTIAKFDAEDHNRIEPLPTKTADSWIASNLQSQPTVNQGNPRSMLPGYRACRPS
jgi:hypothetical protein